MGIDMNEKDYNQSARLQNPTILADFDTKVGHLTKKNKFKSWWMNINNFSLMSQRNKCSLS